jgi:hypothetical protein
MPALLEAFAKQKAKTATVATSASPRAGPESVTSKE